MSEITVRCNLATQKFCTAMDKYLDYNPNARKKGLVLIQVTSLKTGKERVLGVAFKGDPRDNGVLLNMCPWCGEGLLGEVNKHMKEEEAACTA